MFIFFYLDVFSLWLCNCFCCNGCRFCMVVDIVDVFDMFWEKEIIWYLDFMGWVSK